MLIVGRESFLIITVFQLMKNDRAGYFYIDTSYKNYQYFRDTFRLNLCAYVGCNDEYKNSNKFSYFCLSLYVLFEVQRVVKCLGNRFL